MRRLFQHTTAGSGALASVAFLMSEEVVARSAKDSLETYRSRTAPKSPGAKAMVRRLRNVIMSYLAILLIGLPASSPLAATPTAPPAVPAASKGDSKSTVTPVPPATVVPATPAQAAGKPLVRGKEIGVAIATFGSGILDPIVGASSSLRGYVEPMFDSFIRVDNQGQLIPGVFTSWKVSADGKQWTFTMRKGVKFHGDVGEATAEDAKFSLERYLAPDSSYKGGWGTVFDKAEVLDPYTLRVTTKLPHPLLPVEISQFGVTPVVYLMPKKYIEQRGVEAFRKHPIGSGPYQFKSYTADSSLELTAFDAHWGIQPGYDTLKIMLVPNESARIGLLRQGRAQVIEITPDGARDVKAAGFDVRAVPGNILPSFQFYGAYYKTYKGPTSDLRVRKALSLAINRKELVDALMPGGELPNAPGVSYANQDIDVAKWAKKAAEIYTYDVPQAKRLLSEAGYPNGFEISLFTYDYPGAPLLTVAQVVLGYWERIGVKAKIIPTDYAGLRPQFDLDPLPSSLVGQASTMRYLDRPDAIVNHKAAFYSGNKGIFRLLNTDAKTSAVPEVDQLMDALASEFDIEKRKKINDRLLTIMVDSYTLIPLASIPTVFGVDPKVDLDVRPFSQIGTRIIYAKPKT